VAVRSKAYVFGRSPAEIVGSNPTGGMDVCCECCVLSGRDLCDALITRPEESYRLWRIVVCDQETSKNEEAKDRYRSVVNTTTMGCNARKQTNKQLVEKGCGLGGHQLVLLTNEDFGHFKV
jgi:hypothetical protein